MKLNAFFTFTLVNNNKVRLSLHKRIILFYHYKRQKVFYLKSHRRYREKQGIPFMKQSTDHIPKCGKTFKFLLIIKVNFDRTGVNEISDKLPIRKDQLHGAIIKNKLSFNMK